jgi:opacity protein-like surface antigen
MFFRLILKLSLAAIFVIAAIPAFSQVAPSAHEGGLPLVVGVGFSNFATDFGPGRRMDGVSVWADWQPSRLPGALRGLGIEAEGRDINFGRPSALSKMRQDTAEGGPIYTWRHYRNFHPYAKYLIGFGSIDFPPYGTYSHDTRTVLIPGGGAEYRAYRNIWVRGDYEYQYWRHIFGPHDLNPNGVTIGVSYDFGSFRRH